MGGEQDAIEIIRKAKARSETKLHLGSMGLKTIPKELYELTQLRQLWLNNNHISKIPKELAKLSKLKLLVLFNNRIITIPTELMELNQLIVLDLSNNRINAIPATIAKFSLLEHLNLSFNKINVVPTELSQLQQLHQLYLSYNRITAIPTEFIQFKNIKRFEIDHNPLVSPPPEIVSQGIKAIWAFLREQKEASRREWVSKMILVGEGGVGKTCLLKALRGEIFDPDEDKTDGIWIDELMLEHPSEPGVTMKLKTWDFGGQQIYHATHQFFLTERSLYVLVWNSRVGYEQSKLEYWLKNIQARAPESPILLVATHIDQHAPDLPFKELQAKFPKIVGQWQVSNSSGQGISEFKNDLRNIAADSRYLPHMGETWPKTWLDAADRFRSIEMREKKCVSVPVFNQYAIDCGVKFDDIPILTRLLHELGDILYFQDVEELKGRVILNPQWVTDHIFMVLDSEEVKENSGILNRYHVDHLWTYLDSPLHDLFLNLMEKFDLSYQTRENKDISIVVEHLKYEPPNYENLWNSKKNCQEITMKFRLGQDLLPGIPTWFIARAHRFTTHNHWKLGGLFADEGEKHLGLIKAFSQERYVQLQVRGPYPPNFFGVLKDILELTLKRYKGLEITRTIPCPGHNGKPCPFEFPYDDVVDNNRNRKIQCLKSKEMMDTRDLLAGIATSDFIPEDKPKQEPAIQEWNALHQREFMKTFEEVDCPRLFTLLIADRIKARDLFGQKLILQLYCEEPGHWHSTGETGCYTIQKPKQWIQTLAPYARRIVGIAKYAVSGLDILEKDIQKMEETLKLLESISSNTLEESEMREFPDIDPGEGLFTKRAEGAELRALHTLLCELDKAKIWGGLRKVPTPQGQYLWLCEEHAREYR